MAKPANTAGSRCRTRYHRPTIASRSATLPRRFAGQLQRPAKRYFSIRYHASAAPITMKIFYREARQEREGKLFFAALRDLGGGYFQNIREAT